MRAKDIAGLTPEQIQDKYSLPNTPDHIIDVDVPNGTQMEGGIAGPAFGNKGGGFQFRLMEQIPTKSFMNIRALPSLPTISNEPILPVDPIESPADPLEPPIIPN